MPRRARRAGRQARDAQGHQRGALAVASDLLRAHVATLGLLVSDQALNHDQSTQLRANWTALKQVLAQGGVPILGNGVKWNAMTMTSEDSQVNEAQRFSGEDLARVYGVPLSVVGEMSHGTLSNVEQRVSPWLSTGLTNLLELIERDLNNLFDLDAISEYIDLDPRALLRTDFAGRIEALCKGIQGGLFKRGARLRRVAAGRCRRQGLRPGVDAGAGNQAHGGNATGREAARG